MIVPCIWCVDAYENARVLCDQYYNAAPECKFFVRSRKSVIIFHHLLRSVITVPLSCSCTCQCILHEAAFSMACLDHLAKRSMIVTSSTADRDHWSRSLAPPSVNHKCASAALQYRRVINVWPCCPVSCSSTPAFVRVPPPSPPRLSTAT